MKAKNKKINSNLTKELKEKIVIFNVGRGILG